MKFTNFPLIASNINDKNDNYVNMGDFFLSIQVIKRRIDKQTNRYFKYQFLNPRKCSHAKVKVGLDIKSLIIFSKIYLDFLTKYINQFFFKEISGLSSKSYHQHINSLIKVRTDNQIFLNYKEYILQNGLKLVYRIGLLRDKLLTHSLVNRYETILVDSERKKIGLSIERLPRTREQEHPIIHEELKKDILSLISQYKLSVPEQKATKLHDFEYFDYILKQVEEIAPDCPINMGIGVLRQRLGVILDSSEIFDQIFQFTLDLKQIFRCPDVLLLELPDER